MTTPDAQWEPTQADVESARVTDFARFAASRADRELTDYHALWQWSVDDAAAFWAALWDYFELGERPADVLTDDRMPGARWFPGTRLNYVDQIRRN
ncbi:acetyl-coenzyme A synthetase N-terminal domain-containing protein, partial [Mycolicibacterium sp.]|uniref:acetyl-coenzyme A synthetase N-terminal domain-containing protein n=1 Tax=Mycolicibacterium sp. TaxID=2320850 RepID=UPI0037C7E189